MNEILEFVFLKIKVIVNKNRSVWNTTGRSIYNTLTFCNGKLT